MIELANKKVLVVGAAASGLASARLLTSHGARVTINDARPAERLPRELDELRKLGVALEAGGHPEALFVGADLIVVSPGVPADLAALEAARRAGVRVIGEVELAGWFLRGRLLGITGSNGKTTTTSLTGDLMRAAGALVQVGGNIGAALTGLIDGSTDDGWTVAELSSFQLETIDTLRVLVAVLTNLTADHLDRHGSFEAYARAKHRIFANQTAEDFAVLNADSQAVVDAARDYGIAARKVWFSGRGAAGASVYARDGRLWTTLASEDGNEVEVMRLDEIPLRGAHNVENVCAALAATICAMGVRREGLEALRQAIREFKGVEHRIEFVEEICGVKYYNDSKATNVDSTVKALEAFEGGVIVILGGKDKGSDYTPLRPLVNERVKQIVLLGAASDIIAAQLEGTRPMTRAASMREAVDQAAEAAVAGDTVLLAPACASFDMFESYEHRGRVFKEEVRRLAARAAKG